MSENAEKDAPVWGGESGVGPNGHAHHAILRYENGRAVAACGAVFQLAFNYWYEPSDTLTDDLCSRCRNRIESGRVLRLIDGGHV